MQEDDDEFLQTNEPNNEDSESQNSSNQNDECSLVDDVTEDGENETSQLL